MIISRIDDFWQFGPKAEDHPSIGTLCPGCRVPFQAGDYTTLITVGPGPDLEEQERALVGRSYNAVALEAHWTCVTGQRGDG